MALLGNKKEKTYDTGDLKVPVSLGVIMDGNGRWATNRHLPRSAGHKVGAENLKELCRNCVRYGVKYLTVYAFSTENWARPQPEVDFLMKLFVELFDKYDEELAEEGIRVRFTGDDSELPKRVREVCKTAEERSKNRPNMQLIVALNYGGRREILNSCRQIAGPVRGEIPLKLSALRLRPNRKQKGDPSRQGPGQFRQYGRDQPRVQPGDKIRPPFHQIRSGLQRNLFCYALCRAVD